MRNSHKFLLSLIAIIWIIIIGFIFFVIGTFLAPYHVSKQEYQEYLDRKPVYVVNGYNFFNGKPLNTTLNEFGEIMENGKKLVCGFSYPEFFITIEMQKKENIIEKEITLTKNGIEVPLTMDSNGLRTKENNEYRTMIENLELTIEVVKLPGSNIRELSYLGKNWKLDKQVLGSGSVEYEFCTKDIDLDLWDEYILSLEGENKQINTSEFILTNNIIEYKINSFYNSIYFIYSSI